jgi:hypothetical protein
MSDVIKVKQVSAESQRNDRHGRGKAFVRGAASHFPIARQPMSRR